MKTKQLVILVIVLAVLGLIAILQNKRGNADWRESQSENATTILADSFDTEAIYSIEIKGKDKDFSFKRTDDGWKCTSRFDYPANVKDLMQIIVDMTDTKIAQNLTADASQEESMQLTEAEGATSLRLLDKEGKELKNIIFGKKIEKESDRPQMAMYGMSGNTPIGRFIKFDDKVCVVANTFSIVDNDVKSWFDSEFFKVSDMKSATLSMNQAPLWTVSRENKSGDLSLLGDVPEGKEVDTSKLSSIKTAFSWIRFNDIADPSAKAEEIGMDQPKVLTVLDFDGNVYTMTIGKPVDGKQFMKVTIAWNGATVREPGKDEKPEDKEKLDKEFADKVTESKANAEKQNARLSKWIYEVGTSALSAVDKSFDELLKEKKKEEKKD